VATYRRSDREISAICGNWYAERVAEVEARGRIDPQRWDMAADDLIDQLDRHESDPPQWTFVATAQDLIEAEELLRQIGRATDNESLEHLARRLHETKIHVARTLVRHGSGDFRPDEAAEKFAKAARATPSPPRPGTTFDDLARGWARDAGHDPDARPIPHAYYGASERRRG
jgi:hypothetical protein